MLAMSRIIPNALSSRELPPTFTLHIRRVLSHYEGTISNNSGFDAKLYYTDMDKTEEIPCTSDRRTYDFMLWQDSYILIEYAGKRYVLDTQAAEEEIQG